MRNFSTRLKCRMLMESRKMEADAYLRTSVSPPKGARKLICGMGPTSLPEVKILTEDRGIISFIISKLSLMKFKIRLVNIGTLTL